MLTKKIIITGQVQGVGFRPFIFRLAQTHRLTGWVQNKTGQVETRVQGREQNISAFENDIINNHPPLAKPHILLSEICAEETLTKFSILESQSNKKSDIHIPADFFTCNDCLNELMNKNERRYRYPFINCTQCGPRYTLIEKLPYDRPNTSMKNFPLCTNCYTEYSDVNDRRFHAQPLACEKCGPVLSFYSDSQRISGNSFTLVSAIEALNSGKILAIKGIGGYHLMCDASNEIAVQTLRDRKHRPDKPFAILFPWRGANGTDEVLKFLEPSEKELQQLTHPSRAIVLIKSKNNYKLAKNISPGLNEIGAMLPYSPLHFLLSHDFNKPLLATSANFTGEPVITDNDEAEQRLLNIADAFVHHNRPILRPADDSVIRIINNQAQHIRLGRGIAPLEKELPFSLNKPVLAVGGHMKNTIALAWKNRIVISPHIGDLSSVRSMMIFEQVIEDLTNLYQIQPEVIICDAHPDYASSRWAAEYADNHNKHLHKVYHHHAHASTLCGEQPDKKNWLVFTWDGSGYANDGSIWGGEALFGRAGQWKHAATFRSLNLVGGDKASLQPWRSSMAMIWAENLDWKADNIDTEIAYQGWSKNLGCFTSSAVGRLFDAAASFILQLHTCSFDGQAPMQLEQITSELKAEQSIDLPVNTIDRELLEINWAPLIKTLCDESLPQTKRSNIFHSSMAMSLLKQAKQLRGIYGEFTVGLSGGVFQNKKLTEFIIRILTENNFEVFTTDNIPCNDAGICYGQVIEQYFK
jgi:hydrogenase maturation protein HypF